MQIQLLEQIIQTVTITAILFGVVGLLLPIVKGGKLPNVMLTCSIIFGFLSFLIGIIWPLPEFEEKSYYEILLQNISLPSLNVWKDPYTKNFDMTVL